MLKLLRQTGFRFLAVLLATSLALTPVSSALAQVAGQTDAPDTVTDTEAPVLIHRQLEAGIAGELQTFLARVSDDFGIRQVVLYYRQSDSEQFKALNMRPLIDSIGEYMIAVETSERAHPGFQYYIEAIDIEGNKTNRGFDYAPIVFPLTVPTVVETDDTPAAVVAESVEPEPVPQSEGFSVSPVAIILGVGALLALGALAGGGSDDDSSPSVPPGTTTPDTVTLTVISDQPSAE